MSRPKINWTLHNKTEANLSKTPMRGEEEMLTEEEIYLYNATLMRMKEDSEQLALLVKASQERFANRFRR